MEQEILKDVILMLENGIQDCKSRKDKRILKEIKEYIESPIGE
jgi:hypothetical protein